MQYGHLSSSFRSFVFFVNSSATIVPITPTTPPTKAYEKEGFVRSERRKRFEKKEKEKEDCQLFN